MTRRDRLLQFKACILDAQENVFDSETFKTVLRASLDVLEIGTGDIACSVGASQTDVRRWLNVGTLPSYDVRWFIYEFLLDRTVGLLGYESGLKDNEEGSST